MTICYIDELTPLYNDLIAKAQARFEQFMLTAANDPYEAFRWKGENALHAAIDIRLLKGVLHWCENLAKANDGKVDSEKIAAALREDLHRMTRNTSWSSNPLHSTMERLEMTILARASEPFGEELLSPFQKIEQKIEWAKARARDEAAMWRVKSATAERYKRADGGWTSKLEKAGLWTFNDRPMIAGGKERYVRVE